VKRTSKWEEGVGVAVLPKKWQQIKELGKITGKTSDTGRIGDFQLAPSSACLSYPSTTVLSITPALLLYKRCLLP
jgi:hypothetical protein